MSIFNELLPKLLDISDKTIKSFNDELQAALKCLSKFDEEQQNDCLLSKERALNDKTLRMTLQRINEDDDLIKLAKSNNAKATENPGKRRVSRKRRKDEMEDVTSPKQGKRPKRSSVKIQNETQACLDSLVKFETEHHNERLSAKEKAQKDKTLMTTLQSIDEDENDSSKENDDRTESRTTRRVSKRSKRENNSSPEQDKRQKRNASVKAQSIISKQVNVNLNQKLRRDESSDKKSRHKDDKENSRPMSPIQIKVEKLSLPPEPMDTDCLPLVPVNVKQEPISDEVAMPPPVAPVPKPRKAVQRAKSEEVSSEEETSGRRRTTRNRKQTDTVPVPVPTASTTRSLRASARAAALPEDAPAADTQARPKRTRGRKKASETASETDNVTESAPSSPIDKPRPKRTRRGKNAENEPPKPDLPKEKEPEIISPKEERISQPVTQTSPVMKPIIDKKKQNKNNKNNKKTNREESQTDGEERSEVTIAIDKTQVIEAKTLNVTVTVNNQMDQTVVLQNGVYNHDPDTPKAICGNETVVLESHSRETLVSEKHINDATVVLDKDPKPTNISEDNSLLTDDNSEAEPHTPPGRVPQLQPTSAVKEKVQQFEELAARTTRTKTRAMAKQEEVDNHTPPDKMIKPVLSQETLAKMNSMIFNGKTQPLSNSAAKPRVIPTLVKTHSASASKASTLSRQKEAAEEKLKKDKEDARKKKEAMLEAKRELQKKKREEKMANAAAAREAAERERKLAMELVARGRIEKQLHADQGKIERIKEQERKKQELARKVAETEERRKAEEQARQQRLAEEQRKAEAIRKKQAEESEVVKREAAQMAKEIEKKQKEYQEKQKLKNKMPTPLRIPGTPGYHPVEPVYMADGFQYLTENEEDDHVQRPVPVWSTSKARKLALCWQTQVQPSLVDRLFSVRVHSPDLRAIFPAVERARIQRTSSAVWRTPDKH